MQLQKDNRLQMAQRGKVVTIPDKEFCRVPSTQMYGGEWRGTVFPKWDQGCAYVTRKAADPSEAMALITEGKFRRWDHPYPTD